MNENEVSVVYTELSTIRENSYANLVLSLIETIILSKENIKSTDDVVLDFAIKHNIEKKYDSTTLNKIFVSFLNSIIHLKVRSK